MEFFRKFFPLTSKKSKTQNANDNNINKTKEISVDNYDINGHSQADINLNILESNLINNNEDNTTNDDTVTHGIAEIDTNKTFYTLENVAPANISQNLTHNEPNEMNNEFVPKDAETLTNSTDTSLVKTVPEEVTPKNLIFKNSEQLDVCNDLVSKDADVNTETSTLNNVVDDETMQSLKEFEETLNNFDKNTIINDFGIELINLDEFNEIFDDLDTVDNLYFEDSSAKERKIESTIYRNTEKIKNNSDIDIDSKIHPNIIDNIDTISINSSIEDKKSQIQDMKDIISINSATDKSDSDGYNSSDFEFITETEASMDGFIINFRRENYLKPSNAESEPNNPRNGFSRQCNNDNMGEQEALDPGEGPSRQNMPKNQFEDRSYRKNHHIPEGEDYLGLFQGIYNPIMPVSEIYFLENKSVRASAMNSQYDGIGFDKQLALRRHQPDSSEDEFEDEAKDCAKRILNMYPRENRKRRRRY